MKVTFEMKLLPEQNPDRLCVMVDQKYYVAIIRTEDGLQVRVIPYDWDYPIDTLEVFDADVEELENQAD